MSGAFTVQETPERPLPHHADRGRDGMAVCNSTLRKLMVHRGPYPVPLVERFWVKVEKTPTCWLWKGTILTSGYGQITESNNVGGKSKLAHRLSYEIHKGVIPRGLHLDHLCRVRHCVNPDHLEPVTPKENNRRSGSPSALNALKTHCVHGHELSGRNLQVVHGERHCRTCARQRDRAYHERLWARGLTANGTPRVLNRRRSRCAHGHEFSEANTHWKVKRGYRYQSCRQCARLYAERKRRMA